MENTRLFKQEQQLVEEEEDRFPAVPMDLVEALEHQFPDKLPGFLTTEKELAYLIGQVSIVKFLRDMSGRRT